MAQKRKYNRKEAKEAIPGIREFNKMANIFLKLLSQQVETKKRRLGSISVMVNDYKPLPKHYNTININSIDMQNTRVIKHGQASFNQNMKWEDSYNQRKKGIIL